ncbi:hypothetical protein IMZ48_39130 [Candidatus Bathyarchaeota archaeon]|nr:hypothetical protein [Candidatus Bathyarchaeota archaeon]
MHFTECLDHSARKPYYLSAPNDVWSLGVILVNLTCGRNPWKQASVEDSTYRAFASNPEFLKTILPITDDLNLILRRIFEKNPERRVSLSELRSLVRSCPRFTAPLDTPPVSPEPPLEYVCDEDAILDDADYDAPLSPASTDSDDASLASSVSSLEDDFMTLEHQQQQQLDQQCHPHPHAFDPVVDESAMAMFPNQEFVAHTYTGPVAPLQEQPMVHVPVQVSPMPAQEQSPDCAPKSHMNFWWEMVKYAQQVPALQPHVPFHQQVPLFTALQGY